MYCTNCGKEINTEKCPYCGHDSSAPQTPVNNNVFDEVPNSNAYNGNDVFNEVPNQQTAPNYNNNYGNVPVQLQKPPLGMGWFKFLINFALIASGILNVITGIVYFTGASYEIIEAGMAAMVYEAYPELKILDVVMGIFSLVFAGFVIATRFLLAGYKKIGPIFLYVIYGFTLVINLVYIFVGAGILGVSVAQLIDTSTISSLIVSVAMLVINIVYFTKRRELFVK